MEQVTGAVTTSQNEECTYVGVCQKMQLENRLTQCCQTNAKSFKTSNKLKLYQCSVATHMYSIKASNTSIEFVTRSRV